MEIQLLQKNIATVTADLIAVNLFEGQVQPGSAAGSINDLTDGFIARHIATNEFIGKEGELLVLHTPVGMPAIHIIVLGLGKVEEYSLVKVRQSAARLVQKAKELKAKTVATIIHGAGTNNLDLTETAQVFVEGLQLGSYQFDRYKTQDRKENSLETIILVESDKKRIAAFDEGARLGDAVSTAILNARDIINEPPSKIKPSSMVAAAQEIASLSVNMTTTVLDEEALQAEGYNTLLAVAAGSEEKPYLVHLHYQPSKPKGRVAFVGKGVTFDSGGLGIKPWGGMLDMKTDMAGAATVLGIFQALAELETAGKPVPYEVEGIIVTTENMISGKAMKPDDIIYTKNGKTVEVVHTDAEGRLILADGLAYATLLDPDIIIDYATLTGAAIRAVGTSYAAIMGNDQVLIDAIRLAGDTTGELVWQLPLPKEYHRYIESSVADLQNIASGDRGPDAIVAGLFLQEFVGETPWVHIDIAGPSFSRDSHNPVYPNGASGFGILLGLKLLGEITIEPIS